VADKVSIINKDEVYVKVQCHEGVAMELRDYFTFQVPGYQFSPQIQSQTLGW
jgi:hypothetical protein